MTENTKPQDDMNKLIDNNNKLYNKYYDEISRWDWKDIKRSALANVEKDYDGNMVGTEFLGTVFALTPSGKYYMPFAHSNVTEEEANDDEQWGEALEAVAKEHGMYISSGEGDPCDILAQIIVENIEEDAE